MLFRSNGFGRRSLQEWDAHLLHEANIPAPPDMRAPGQCRLSTGDIPVPLLPDVTCLDYFNTDVERARASLTEEQRACPKYAAANHEAWLAYFERRQAERPASTKNAPLVRGTKNSDGHRLWWGGNEPPFTYTAAPAPRRSGDQWMPRRTGSSSSSSHSSGSPTLYNIKAEPTETPLGRCSRSASIVINEGGCASSAPPRLVKPKMEPGLAAVKTETGLAGVKTELDDAAAMKWAQEDWAQLELERQCRALEEITARRRGRDEGGVVVLYNSDNDAPPPVRQGDFGQGSSRGDRVKEEKDNNDGGDFAKFIELFL